MKIAVYTIAKNEAPRIGRMIESARDADYRLVLDTGSSDGTVDVARDAGAAVREASILPWRFDTARNVALSLLPPDVDIAICLEADEVLVDGWREEVEKAWVPGTTQLTYLFRWDGGTTFLRERIHARSGYYWHGWTHESVYADPRITPKVVHVPKVLVVDMPPEGRCGNSSYLELLYAWAKVEPHNTRPAFYYARELAFRGLYEKAICEFERFLSLNPTWRVEREYAMRWLGRAHAELGRIDDALHWFNRAAEEYPGMRCPLIWKAQALERVGRNDEARMARRAAAAITVRTGEFTEDPSSWPEAA